MISKKDTLSFYKNPIVQQIIFEESRNKEISFRYGETFGKRPNTISSPKELIVEASKGMTSIHVSEQTWFNPLDVKGTQEGWDLILDIDCKVFEYAKITTDIIVKYLKFLGCECFVKFSGNKGFHIAVPYEYFPRIINGKPLKEMFPYAPRKIATFIQEKTKLTIQEKILDLENGNIDVIKEKTKIEFTDTIPIEKIIEIDTVLIANRHLYRMVYSLHEKSGLVSIPVNKNKIIQFEKSMAKPSNIKEITPWIKRQNSNCGEILLLRSFDFQPEIKKSSNQPRREYKKVYDEPLPVEKWPPCMKSVLNGLPDGNKRAAYCLINFCGKVGWSNESTKELVENSQLNLKQQYINSQLNNFQPGKYLPPNCDNESYYKNLGICQPDNKCKKIKNPVGYN